MLLKLGLVTCYAEYSGISSKHPSVFIAQNFVCRNQYMQMHPSFRKLQILSSFLSVSFLVANYNKLRKVNLRSWHDLPILFYTSYMSYIIPRN